MPGTIPEGKEMDRTDHVNVAALDTRVGVLDNEIREVNVRITGLDEKFDKVMTAFAVEFRAAIAGLSTQFSERNKTPWGILISGAGVVLTMVALLGHQTLSPITENLSMVIQEMVPRKEVEFRYSINDKRLTKIEEELADTRNRELSSLHEQVNALRHENNLLRTPAKP
jgi:peptidoglycan hydrolase CwlO-like protein